MNHTFPRTERLKSTKAIEKLFLEGKTVTKFPIKIFYRISMEGERNVAAFSVPKRNFKLAVQRNRIKRQMREAYRLNKQLLHKKDDKILEILFLFIGRNTPSSNQLHQAMVKLLNKLAHEID